MVSEYWKKNTKFGHQFTLKKTNAYFFLNKFLGIFAALRPQMSIEACPNTWLLKTLMAHQL